MKKKKRESGQALIEFIMLMPIVMSLIWYMVHVNLAINRSVVGQVSARSQLFLKMYNHFAGPTSSDQAYTQRSAFFVGVAGTVVPDAGAGASFPAPVEMLGNGAFPQKLSTANDDTGEAAAGSYRQSIRIRTVFGICTARKVVAATGLLTDFCGSEHSE